MTYRTPQDMIAAGALVVCSHSGGKDSQAMLAYLRRNVPAEQLVIVHANLGHVEWPGTIEHIRETAGDDFAIVEAGKGLLDMVRNRHETRPDCAPWPSARYRQCTSDLKRGPIYKWIRHEMKRRGVTLAINAMGLRAEESSARAKRQPWKHNRELSKAARTVYDWLPIHDWPEAKVFDYIAEAGQLPHWAYKAGNRRLSCMFCIMGCTSDLRNAAKHNPELAREYIEIERQTGYSMFPDATLAERIGWRDEQPEAEPAEPAQGAGYSIQKHRHTKRNFDFWLVVLADRVDRDEFVRLRSSCKAAGGWYSRKFGSTPGGFAFKEREQAGAWAVQEFGGDDTPPPPKETKRDRDRAHEWTPRAEVKQSEDGRKAAKPAQPEKDAGVPPQGGQMLLI